MTSSSGEQIPQHRLLALSNPKSGEFTSWVIVVGQEKRAELDALDGDFIDRRPPCMAEPMAEADAVCRVAACHLVWVVFLCMGAGGDLSRVASMISCLRCFLRRRCLNR